MKSRMKLGDFLVSYLRRAGVEHVFGLPGDLVLGLFHRFGRSRGLEIVTFSHEPAVGFAADGYARSTRRLGVVCVTYGAGGHNVVNAVAGAYAEQVPLLVLSGGPGEAESKVAAVRSTLQSGDVGPMNVAVQELQAALQRVGQAVYSQTGGPGGPAEGGPPPGEEPGDSGAPPEETVEGEFREV